MRRLIYVWSLGMAMGWRVCLQFVHTTKNVTFKAALYGVAELHIETMRQSCLVGSRTNIYLTITRSANTTTQYIFRSTADPLVVRRPHTSSTSSHISLTIPILVRKSNVLLLDSVCRRVEVCSHVVGRFANLSADHLQQRSCPNRRNLARSTLFGVNSVAIPRWA